MSGIDVSELQGPITELLQQFSGGNGKKRLQEFKLWLKRVAEEKELLSRHNISIIGAVEPFNPHEFFKTKKGLWVSSQFAYRVLSAVDKSVSLEGGITLQPYMLTEAASDTEIRESLPENHVFKADELCAILKFLIEKQWGGKSGLLNEKNYNGNLFYVKGKNDQVCVVFVYWDAGDRKWSVSAGELGGAGGSAGRRIFSRNC